MSTLFVANWKMNLTFEQECSFVKKNIQAFKEFSKKVVLCPSFISLITITDLLKQEKVYDVALCAQGCSPYPQGAYTGMVSAQSLVQAGCSYVMIGHSEYRRSCDLSEELVALTITQVLKNNLIPIICFGESAQAYEKKSTQLVLGMQLDTIKRALAGSKAYIAYEPLWAIGTGKTPSTSELTNLFAWFKQEVPTSAFLYGGSVNENNIKELAKITNVTGFLIGKASLDFQQLKKIVSLG